MNKRLLVSGLTLLALLTVTAAVIVLRPDDGLGYPTSIRIPDDVPDRVWGERSTGGEENGDRVAFRRWVNGRSMYLRGHLAGWDRSVMQTQHCPSSIDRDGGESLAIDIEFRGEDRLGVEVFQRGFRN